MSITTLFLIPVPPKLLAEPRYSRMDDCWKGDDYVIDSSWDERDEWDERLDRSAARRRALAMDLSSSHLPALRASKAPRTILVHTDASAPNEQPRSYDRIRKLWLDTDALELPDVADDIVVPKYEPPRTVKPLAAADIRVPLPEGAKHARLRSLEPEWALRQVRKRKPKPEELARVRAAVLVVDVENRFDALRAHYLGALRALGLTIEQTTKFIDFDCVEMTGKKARLFVSVSIQPSEANHAVFEVRVTWIEQLRPADR